MAFAFSQGLRDIPVRAGPTRSSISRGASVGFTDIDRKAPTTNHTRYDPRDPRIHQDIHLNAPRVMADYSSNRWQSSMRTTPQMWNAHSRGAGDLSPMREQGHALHSLCGDDNQFVYGDVKDTTTVQCNENETLCVVTKETQVEQHQGDFGGVEGAQNTPVETTTVTAVTTATIASVSEAPEEPEKPPSKNSASARAKQRSILLGIVHVLYTSDLMGNNDVLRIVSQPPRILKFPTSIEVLDTVAKSFSTLHNPKNIARELSHALKQLDCPTVRPVEHLVYMYENHMDFDDRVAFHRRTVSYNDDGEKQQALFSSRSLKPGKCILRLCGWLMNSGSYRQMLEYKDHHDMNMQHFYKALQHSKHQVLDMKHHEMWFLRDLEESHRCNAAQCASYDELQALTWQPKNDANVHMVSYEDREGHTLVWFEVFKHIAPNQRLIVSPKVSVLVRART